MNFGTLMHQIANCSQIIGKQFLGLAISLAAYLSVMFADY